MYRVIKVIMAVATIIAVLSMAMHHANASLQEHGTSFVPLLVTSLERLKMARSQILFGCTLIPSQ